MVAATVSALTSVIASSAPSSRSPTWRSLLAARACAAKPARSASDFDRKASCQAGLRTCARNAR
jgi:hypothetical protein